MQLTIKNKDRELCWGMGALESLCDELGVSLQDLDIAVMSNDTKVLNQLAYSALRNGAEINDESLDFNYKYFLNWLDNEPAERGVEIVNDFLKSKIMGVTIESRYQEIIARLTANETEVSAPSKKKSKPSEKS